MSEHRKPTVPTETVNFGDLRDGDLVKAGPRFLYVEGDARQLDGGMAAVSYWNIDQERVKPADTKVRIATRPDMAD